jgi:hypothetical protein
LRWQALDSGLITMRDSALDHVINGVIPLSELPRHSAAGSHGPGSSRRQEDDAVSKQSHLQRLPAEIYYRDELQRLKKWDPHPVPPGWNLSPIAVEKFVLGDESLDVQPKIVADPASSPGS